MTQLERERVEEDEAAEKFLTKKIDPTLTAVRGMMVYAKPVGPRGDKNNTKITRSMIGDPKTFHAGEALSIGRE